MRPSPASLARKVAKPLKPHLQVFSSTSNVDLTPAIPRLIPRRNVAPRTSILPAPTPRNHQIKPPTLIETLIAQKSAAGDRWPPNLRVEPFITRETWEPVRKGLRSKLKRMLREE
ncbi:hypothetical protein FB45DRAFT_911880 [Roridomyces roridus]|uniref:Uncharacterized protein n=1 Tax=Roridomyces roridus TaxID=1738132 RepID=A0AAD7BVQ9_9AGAR|nr:hypothetical protein FB45DRAFT_911880 [Roridomyces roridus]